MSREAPCTASLAPRRPPCLQRIRHRPGRAARAVPSRPRREASGRTRRACLSTSLVQRVRDRAGTARLAPARLRAAVLPWSTRKARTRAHTALVLPSSAWQAVGSGVVGLELADATLSAARAAAAALVHPSRTLAAVVLASGALVLPRPAVRAVHCPFLAVLPWCTRICALPAARAILASWAVVAHTRSFRAVPPSIACGA
jgi:ParB-like chromosome segregation protein Spo0J